MTHPRSQVTVYVGDASNLRRRLNQHGHGNVEGSALRKHVARAFGYSLARTRRASGSTRVRVDAPDPRAVEEAVSDYIRSGAWRWVECVSAEEARAFQWVAIEALDPALNVERRPTLLVKGHRQLLQSLRAAPLIPHADLDLPEGPGVYALHHERLPEVWAADRAP